MPTDENNIEESKEQLNTKEIEINSPFINRMQFILNELNQLKNNSTINEGELDKEVSNLPKDGLIILSLSKNKLKIQHQKLLDSQIGNLLVSKFGGRIEVERLIEEEKIILLPFSDIRGYDTSGMHAGIYLSEAQNLDIDLMKLALQRVGSDSICIIDGDEKTQVDDIHFAGVNNGMKRVSAVFRNEDVYGEVELQKIHRSKIAQIAEKM